MYVLPGGNAITCSFNSYRVSVVDTTVVGLTQTDAVTQLAALGPATTLIDSLIYATYFLSITTTNRIAADLAMDNKEQLQQTTSQVLTVAAILGAFCTVFCWTCAVPVLKRMGTEASLLYFASRYTWIRASTAIFAVTGVVLQSICLASFDTRTPAMAVAAASGINLVGDIVLRRFGVLGAATATAMASTASALILFRAVMRNQWKSWNTKQKPLWSIPDRKSALQLLTVSGPIFFVMISKIFCYGAMTLRCTEFGVPALAAQAILMRIFFFFACFGDSFSQTAQSFLPASLYPKRDPASFSRIFKKLLILSGLAGLVNSQASSLVLRRCGQYFLSSASASDNQIVELMKSHAGYMSVSILLHPLIMLLEGAVLASRDFSTLWITYATTVALHFGILKFFCGSFTEVWRTFVLFQTTRLLLYAWRVWRQQKKRTVSDAPIESGGGFS